MIQFPINYPFLMVFPCSVDRGPIFYPFENRNILLFFSLSLSLSSFYFYNDDFELKKNRTFRPSGEISRDREQKTRTVLDKSGCLGPLHVEYTECFIRLCMIHRFLSLSMCCLQLSLRFSAAVA